MDKVKDCLPPVVTQYQDYRKFMEDFYEYKKQTRSGFSYRLFAEKAGMSSPNYLQLVIQGKRNLLPETAQRVAKAMGLSPNESQYFVSLVKFDQAHNDEEKQEAQKWKLRSLKRLVTQQLPIAQAHVLSEWYHLVVRELIFLPDFKADGKWISEKLKKQITPEQADRSIELLLKGGFLEKSKDGRLTPKDPVIDTGDDFGEALVLKNHQDTLRAWKKIIEITPKPKREIGILNIPISKDKIPEFKKRIQAFQDEIIGWLQDEQSPDAVVQLGTYLLQITQDE